MWYMSEASIVPVLPVVNSKVASKSHLPCLSEASRFPLGIALIPLKSTEQ